MEDALAFGALLATTLAAPGRLAGERQEAESDHGPGAETEPAEWDANSDAEHPEEETAPRTAIAALAAPAPVWWMAAPPDNAGATGAPFALGERPEAALPAGAGEVGYASELVQKASGIEFIPAMMVAAGRSQQAGIALTADVAPVAPPEPLRAAAEADGGRQLQAPVSLALGIEARSPLGSSPHGSVAVENGSRVTPSGHVAAHAPGAETRVQPLASEPSGEAVAPAQAHGPAARAEVEPTLPAGDPPGKTTHARPRGDDLEDVAGAIRAQSRPVMEATSVAPPATVEARPQPMPDRQPRTEQGGQPATAQLTEAGAAPEAPREVWLRLRPGKAGGQGQAAVAVQVTERAGRIEVRVRTPDQALGESLRREVPALVERLEREGFRATALDASALTASSPEGALRLAQPENAAASEDERWSEGQGRQGGQREQGRARRENGENANFVSEVRWWLHR